MTSLIINSQKRLEDAQIELSELFETKKDSGLKGGCHERLIFI